MRNLTRQLNSRRAFTLLELLMVVAIIGLLMSFSIVVMSGFAETARVEATSATIQKIQKMMDQRVEAFERAFRGSRKDAAMQLMRDHLSDPDGDGDRSDGIFGVSDPVVEILAKKALFRFEFPQRFMDRTLLAFGDGVTVMPGLTDSIYFNVLAPTVRAEMGLPDTTALNDPAIIAQAVIKFANHASSQETESSELLYFALIKSGSYGASSVDSDLFTNQEVADQDGDGLPEFIDAWGQPLRFYRWPTRLIDFDAPYPFEPNLANLTDLTDTRAILPAERAIANIVMKGLPPAPFALPNGGVPRDALLTDPDDPVGRLYAELEKFDGSNGTGILSTEYNELKYHTPDTFQAPLILSAGPDGRLGLFEPNYFNVPSPGVYEFGNLAQLEGTTTLSPAPSASTIDQLRDNITSRNKKSGGR